MPKLQELATERIGANCKVRICNLRTPAAIRVLAATARLWEIYKRGAKNYASAGCLAVKKGEAK